MKKKYEPRRQDVSAPRHPLDSVPARDTSALPVPTASITVTHNPRSDLGDLSELKDSIAERGILAPLLVAKTTTGVELLGGHRRLQCAKDLGLATVPCRVVETTEPEVVKLIDNIMREDISPEDLCLSLKRLLVTFDGNKSALARAISKSPSYVNRAVKAADLIESGLCARAQPNLSLRALFDLASAEDPAAALEGAANETSDAIRQAKAGSSTTPGKPSRGPSGALPGGRAVAQAIQFHERRGGAAFSLRVHFDAEKTAPETKAAIIKKLEALVERLKGRE